MTRRGWALFGAMGVIWGIPYLLIRVAVRELDPATLVFARTAPAALLLLAPALRGGPLRPLLGRWHWIAAYTVVEVALPWLFLSSAEQHLTSSTSGLLIAVVPLAAAVFHRCAGGSRLGRRRVSGLVLGLAGVAALVGIGGGHVDVGAVAEMSVPVVGYALGPFIVSRRLSDLPSLQVVALSLAGTALIYAPVALAHPPRHLSAQVLASIVVLAVVCTALGFVVYFALIADVGPTRATVVTYVNPAVAVLLGVVILGEPFTVGIAVGFPLILVGSVLATGGSGAPAGRDP